MEALRILEQYQGKGIGQYFVEEVIKKAKEQGIKGITIGVEDDNLIAKHIYSKLGFNEFIRREAGDKYALDGFDVFLKRL
jgi:ribosomal protein S18 acetylase RimI-like enzyme